MRKKRRMRRGRGRMRTNKIKKGRKGKRIEKEIFSRITK